jgi:hypothetical protein
LPSWSFQNPTGMLGIGAVITSSPSRPTTGLPSGSYACTFAPRQRQAITPSVTGSSGTPPTKPVQTSVPPDSDCSCRSAPTCSYTQSKPSGGSGAPVEPMARMLPCAGDSPAFRQASRKGAEVPK